MGWIIVVIALLVAIGPVLYLIPSKRDRRLARLRQQAKLTGFIVELHPVRQTNPELADRVTAGGQVRTPTHPSVAYTLRLTRKIQHLSLWRVLRDEHSTTPIAGWQLDQGEPESLKALPGLLDALPEDVVGVELKRMAFTCFWLENPPAAEAEVDGLKATMEAIMRRVLEEDEARDRTEDDDEIS